MRPSRFFSNFGELLQFVYLCVSGIKTGTRRIMRLDVVCRLRRNLKECSSKQIMCLKYKTTSTHYRGLPRGLSDKRHCVKMWRQFVTKVPTADRSWQERSDNLRKRQSIFHFDKATTALFFFDGDIAVMTWQGQRDSFGALLFAFMVDQLYKY